MGRPRQIAGMAAAGLAQRHNLARLRVLRDLTVFLRIECLGVLLRSGLADALRAPGTATELARRAGLLDVELTTAVLDLAVSQRLVRRTGDRYSPRGSRMRGVLGAPDVAGTAEEAVAHDGPIYAAMADHLRGAPSRPYDAGLGDVIARVSRVAEPIVGPWIADTVRALAPRRMLDVGCGT
ncbi:MAG TPA: hypothetical protein VJ804_14860, partial [Acidimicrobiales bacterium]|nr:hypothetical protein [Acidimicrobiales bacterium]